jgi:hypothetical protein
MRKTPLTPEDIIHRREQQKAWRIANPEKVKASIAKNKDARRARAKAYSANNKDKKRDYDRAYYKAHPERVQAWSDNGKPRRQQLMATRKQIVLNHYGNTCECCGEPLVEFLTIDHINGGGNKHRKSIGNIHFYSWLIKNNFPIGYRTLCMNCNFATRYGAVCPHKLQ